MRNSTLKHYLLAHGFISAFCLASAQAQDVDNSATDNLLRLSLSDLLDVKINAVGKKPQTLSDIPAAVFVISYDDIRQTGVRTIPDLLRMVPGMHISQANSHAWEVSARGFHQLLANKMLVMVDGRSVYVREFSGVWWEQLNLIVDDIERIEVVRGPGGTVWGANAVNGVVNIITRSAKDTKGGLINIALGDQLEYLSSVRYADKIAKKTYLRLYAQTRSEQSENVDLPDPYKNTQVGFRMDGQWSSKDKWTLQGDYYQGRSTEVNFASYDAKPQNVPFHGGNLLGRWQRDLGNNSEFQTQVYVDYYDRDANYVRSRTRTLDLDLQHRFRPHKNHEIVWGLDWRHYQQQADNSEEFSFTHTDYSENLFSVFVQDEITLVKNRWYLTVGSKFEHMQNIGWQAQPSARLLWTPNKKRSLWAGISRAVRMPDWGTTYGRWSAYYPVRITGIPIMGNIQMPRSALKPERLLAYELGWREMLRDDLFMDANLYYHDYDDSISTVEYGVDVTPTGLVVNMGYENVGKQHSYGAELSSTWQVNRRWKLQGAYTYIRHVNPFESRQYEPKHQVSLRSYWQFKPNWALSAWLRYTHDIDQGDLTVAEVPIPSHTDLDLRLSWQARSDLELSLSALNVLKRSHDQSSWSITSQLYVPTQRHIYAQLHWHF